MGNLESIRYFTPELIIVAFAILVILFDLVSQGQSPKGTAYLSLAGLLFNNCSAYRWSHESIALLRYDPY